MEKITISKENYNALHCCNYFAQGLIEELRRLNFPRLSSVLAVFPNNRRMIVSSVGDEMTRESYRQLRETGEAQKWGYEWREWTEPGADIHYTSAVFGTSMLIDFGGDDMYFAS